jgi:hypothetical protein
MSAKNIGVSGGLRTEQEEKEAGLNRDWFDKNSDTWESKMENFPKYVKVYIGRVI